MIRVLNIRMPFFLLFIFWVVTSDGLSQTPGLNIGQSFRIHPSNVSQTEVFITTSPVNPNILFASANTIVFQPSFFVSEGIYVSTDGGTSWAGSDTCSGEYIDFHGGDPGIAIDKDGTFILTRLGRAPVFPGLYSHYSTDNGATWSLQKSISLDDLERASTVSDVNSASPFYGKTYTAYVRFSPPYPVMFAYTDDGARNWSVPLQLNSPANRSAGGELAIGPSGEVYVTWAGVSNSSPFTEIYGGFGRSTDGGQNWFINNTAFEMRGIVGLLPQKQNIRVNGLPRMAVDKTGGQFHGTIYIITTERNFGAAGSDPDIILRKSTDNGNTWNSGVRVNQDPFNNGKIQYFPAIEIDNLGGINIIYYDDRNTTSDSASVFLSRSLDGGETWTEYEISGHRFKPVPIGGLGTGYQGDNIDIVLQGNTLWPVWMDNSTGVYQIWTAPIEIFSTTVNEDFKGPIGFKLHQNYPNPFNPVTTISWETLESGRQLLKIYNIIGDEIAVLADEYKPAGKYSVQFDASEFGGLSSGVYFIRLSVNNKSKTRSMVLLK